LAERRLLIAILNGFPERLLTAELGRPPEGFRPTAPPRARWLYYTISLSVRQDYIRARWQGAIASGLYRDVAPTPKLPPLDGHTFFVVRPGRPKKFDHEARISRSFEGATARRPREALLRLIKVGARKAGLRIERVQFADPLNYLAPEIFAVAPRPRAFLADQADSVDAIIRPIAIAQGQPLSDGVYLEVRDSRRRWLSSDGVAVRAGIQLSAITNRSITG
jgi:hypothetical protein